MDDAFTRSQPRPGSSKWEEARDHARRKYRERMMAEQLRQMQMLQQMRPGELADLYAELAVRRAAPVPRGTPQREAPPVGRPGELPPYQFGPHPFEPIARPEPKSKRKRKRG